MHQSFGPASIPWIFQRVFMRIILLFLFLLSSGFAVDPTYLLALTESDPSALVDGKVNAITGDLYLIESDLQVQGYEPIPLVRSYMSHERGDWMFIPHVNASVKRTGDDWIITEKYGTPVVYRNAGKKKINGKKFYRYEPLDLKKGFSNTSQGIISSETNLKNNYILFDEKYKEFTLCCANGSERRYHKNYKGEGNFRLISEKLPNGKQMVYDYREINDKYLGLIFSLTSIASKNPSGDKTFARANFDYEDLKRKNKHFFIRGSDATSIEYQFRAKKREGYRRSGELESVVSTVGPDLQLKTKKHRDRSDWRFEPDERVLTSITSAGKRNLSVDYYLRTVEYVRNQRVIMEDPRPKVSDSQAYMIPDLRRGKVKTLLAPVGPNDTLLETHSFFYDFANRKTTVYDSADCRTEYTWNEDLRLQKIDRYDGTGALHSGEEFQWEEGNLLCKSFFDQNRNTLFSRGWAYDSLGNVKEETLTGNLTGEKKEDKTIRRTSYEGKWPSRHEDDQGLVVLNRYVPETNLICSKSLCDGDIPKISYIYEYDADLVLVREIVNDTISKKIRDITPCKNEPYYGMPEIIEEKYEDQGCETLLRKTVFHYGTGGKVAQKDIYDADGVYRYSLNMGYDKKGRLVSETNPMGWESIVRYDDAGNKAFSQDVSGNTSQYTYDSANRLIQKEEIGFDGISRTFLYTYDTKNNLTSETDGYGNVTKYVRTPVGKVKEMHLPAVLDENFSFSSPIIQFQFDSAGNEIERIDPLGHRKESSYNARGKPLSIKRPGNGQEKFTYYPCGSLKSETDAEGLTINYARDYLDRVVSEEFIYDGKCLRTEKFGYTGLLLTGKTDSEGHQTFYFYDQAARKIAEECEGEKTTFYYDSLGRVDKMQTDSLEIFFHYDLLGRLEERKEMDVRERQLLRKETYEYDRANNITAIRRSVDGQDIEENFGYDSRNRLIWHISPTGAKESVSYNDHYLNEYGQKVLQKIHTDPQGLQTIETYDALGRCVNIEQKKERTLSNVKKHYNLRGDLSLQVDTVFAPDGTYREIRTKWDYDAAGRVSQLTEAEGTLYPKITKYTYALRGDKKTITKPDGTILKYTTDPFGSIVKITSSDNTVTHEMRYDKRGNLIWNDGIKKTWDAKGRLLSEVFSDFDHAVLNTYNLLGQRTDCKIPLADCWITYKYNALDMTEVARKNTFGCDIYSFKLSHDLSGNLQEIQLPNDLGSINFSYDKASRKIGLKSPVFSQTVTETDLLGNILSLSTMGTQSQFTYDDLYQLASESGLFCHHYTYDSLFCRIKNNNESYQINDLNQLISHFDYDKSGNPKRQRNIHYDCDALDRLIRLETEDTIYAYTYDAMHRKISSKTTSKKIPFQEVRYLIYDGQNEIGSFNEQGHLKELRILGPTPRAEIGATLAVELNNQSYLSTPDLCGNIAAIFPFEGGSPELTYYSAFGEEIGSKISPWRFASKRVETTDLIHFGRRYYIPSLGRWLTPDPLGLRDGMNLYAYIHNNPLTHFDEYGLLDFGQYEKDWHKHSKRCHKALVHEVGTQAVDLVDLAFSSPYHLERGFNYVTGRQTYQTENWKRCQNRFFESATNWIYQAYPTDMTHPDYLRMRTGAAVTSLAMGGYGLAKAGIQTTRWGINTLKGYHSTSQLAKTSTQIINTTKNASYISSNPLQGTRYTEKTLLQMRKKLKTGEPDFHGFPQIVDNYAGLGRKELIKGKDGLNRTKIYLDGGYKGQDGYFEWIIEADQTINHRLFISNP